MSHADHPLGTLFYRSFIIVLILVAIALGVSYNNSNQTVITQASTIRSLDSIVNATNLENSRLQGEVTTLTTERGNLQSQVTTLANETASLQSMLVQISANMTKLTGEVNDLNIQLGDKNIQLDNLTTLNTNLGNQVASLNTQASSLQSQLSNQTSIVNMGKSVVLEKDSDFTIPMGTTSYLTYKTGFAGYILVSLTSTSGVSFGMGNSQETDIWFGTYPSTGTVSTGTFKVPVMPGKTYIRITNPSMTNDVVLYLYLTYVY